MNKTVIPMERIAASIYLIRKEKVMLDFDLATLYGVETRILVQAVKRNIERFPRHFMFQLSEKEFDYWRSQIVMSNPSSKMGLRRPPYVFTEQGVAMLSAVLRSKRAIQVSIAIMDTFVRLREMLATHKDLAMKIEEHDPPDRKSVRPCAAVANTTTGRKEPYWIYLAQRPMNFSG